MTRLNRVMRCYFPNDCYAIRRDHLDWTYFNFNVSKLFRNYYVVLISRSVEILSDSRHSLSIVNGYTGSTAIYVAVRSAKRLSRASARINRDDGHWRSTALNNVPACEITLSHRIFVCFQPRTVDANIRTSTSLLHACTSSAVSPYGLLHYEGNMFKNPCGI